LKFYQLNENNMPCDIVKAHKSILKDKLRKITYVIYSNRKLNKKEMLREIRYYYVKNDFALEENTERIMIISRD
jgi:hypothetical protein